ncbi:flavin reductase family protein [Marinoscillum sp. MHG1-6]|uniref:flavin reductase family protein n=1 Tax=Marinoscillum sp. MHG1-6 TaxID=2959627 RepID=UPI0021584E77|nr:flavin reductase family protein [Marinoscillum sp. MHG1-6]
MPERSPYLTINPDQADTKTVHQLLLSGVAPRPIALVSTVSKDGIPNLSPFSFFNAFGANPPYVAFSPANSGKDGSVKDTLNNLKEVPECVVQAVPYSIVEQINLASTLYPSDINEFEKSGLTPIDSEMVAPKRVWQSPFQMECKADRIISLGGDKGSGNLVICKVVLIHVREAIYQNGTIPPDRIDLVGRNGGSYYTRAIGNAMFELAKPNGLGVGIDLLPEHIRNSKILTGNNLGRLGGLAKLPTNDEIEAFFNNATTMEPNQEYISDYIYVVTQSRENREEKIEHAAKLALENGDLHFAIHALMSIPLLNSR